MNEIPIRVPSPTRCLRSRGGVLLSRAVPALLLVLALVGCGAQTVVRTSQQVLTVSPAIYDAAMTFAEQNKAKLSPDTLAKFEVVRVQFPPAYRAFDAGLATYLAVEKGKRDPVALLAARAGLDSLIRNVSALVVLNGGPDLVTKYGVK